MQGTMRHASAPCRHAPATLLQLQPCPHRHHSAQCQWGPSTSGRHLQVCFAQAGTIASSLAKVAQLEELAAGIPSIKGSRVQPKRFVADLGDRVGFVARTDVGADGVVLTVAEDVAITRIDAEQHEVVGAVAAESSELVALTLWLMAERHAGAASPSHAFISTLPAATMTPLLWEDCELTELLAGSPALPEAQSRKAALQQQWQDLQERVFSQDTTKFPQSVYNQAAFQAAFSVVLAHAVYLPSANCFALLPVASLLGRTGAESGCALDYDPERQAAVVTTPRMLRSGTEVLLYDPRPNTELLLATGVVPDVNPADCLAWEAKLLPADRYFMMKSEILQSLGFSATEQFPVYADRFPNQLLAFLRLSRISDPALFAKVSFEKDVELSQMNEYEILQLLMGDCRERLQAYTLSTEEDVKLAQQRNLDAKQRLAVKLRLSEKKIINATMEAVRTRLAPIRGIPTKSGGMQDPNSDITEIFDALESIPAAPGKLLEGFARWARGEDDPDWGKKPSAKPKAPRPW